MTGLGVLAGTIVSLMAGMKLWLTWKGASLARRLVTGLAGAGGLVLLGGSVLELSSANLVAVVAILVLAWHQYHGVKESVRFTTILSVIETALVAVFIFLTVGRIDSANLTPIAPFGWSGIISGAALIFFAYIGFDSITTMAEECKDPKKDMPKGILWSLGVCTVLYILTGLGMVGAVSYLTLDANAPLADVLSKLGYGWLVSIFALAVLISIKSTLSVLLFAQSRIVMRMSMDGLLPRGLGAVSARRQTPYVAILAVGVISAVAAGLFPIAKLAELVNIGVLAAFVAVCIGVIILRYTHPDMPRSFRSPLVPWLPAVGGLASLVMMFSLSYTTWLIFLGWTLVGVFVYLFFGRKNSKLN
jgi:APA family basic amino acid/polyamine antiporter